jgi:hypothetical protein
METMCYLSNLSKTIMQNEFETKINIEITYISGTGNREQGTLLAMSVFDLQVS